MRDITPRIGLFWIISQKQEFLEYSVPYDRVAIVAGFRTLNVGHVDIWKKLIRKRPDLANFAYEYFPRGRVNWSESDGFILLMDKTLIDNSYHHLVISSWRLPPENTTVLNDAHYRHHDITTIISGGTES